MKKLSAYPALLGQLYNDEIRFVEEISIIERMYLNPELEIFVGEDDLSSFLLIRKSSNGRRSVFLRAEGNELFLEQALNLLKTHRKFHLQTGDAEAAHLKGRLKFNSEYEYVIMTFDPGKFRPIYDPTPVRLSPEMDVRELSMASGEDPLFCREEIRHGVVYGFRSNGKWISLGGACIRSRNFDYVFVDTDAEFRGKGLAGAALSHAIKEILESGRKPIYALDSSNKSSMKLAVRIGFVPYKSLRCLFYGPWVAMRGAEDREDIPDSSFLE